MTIDYYQVLEVTKTSSAQEIKTSYRKLAMKYHPDRNANNPEAVEKFKQINEAYGVLSDEDKRSRYDRFGTADPKASFTGDIFDLFNTVVGQATGFASNFATRQAKQGLQGEDIQTDLTITLEQARAGATVEVEIDRLAVCDRCHGSRSEPGSEGKKTCPSCNGVGQVQQQTQSFLGTMVTTRTCPQCRGVGEIITVPCGKCVGSGRHKVKETVEVQLPKGIDSGYSVRIPNEGNAGLGEGRAGNLLVYINVKKHEHFVRDGEDLHYKLNIGLAQATLGSAFEIPTMDEPEVLNIPAGTQPNTQFRLRSKGMPRLQRFGMGDLIITANVIVPKHLSDKAKEVLEVFAQEVGENIEEHESLVEKIKGFFKRPKNEE